MFMATQLIGFAAGQLPKVTYAWASNTTNGTSASTHTYAGQGIGTAATTRRVVFAIQATGGTGTAVSSATVGGTAASLIVARQHSGDTSMFSEMWWAPLATGTTADIVVNYNNTKSRSGLIVWAVYDAFPTAADTDGSESISPSVTITAPAQGIVLAAAHLDHSASVTWSWTGISEDADERANGVNHTGASAAFTAGNASLAVQATSSGPANRELLIAAAFRPY